MQNFKSHKDGYKINLQIRIQRLNVEFAPECFIKVSDF